MATEHFLYLVTRGRQTGQPRAIEIWYVESGGRFYIVAEKGEQTQWVKNVRAHPDVSFAVGSRGEKDSHVHRTAARARIVDDTDEVELAAQIRGLMNQKYGWSDGLVVEIAPAS